MTYLAGRIRTELGTHRLHERLFRILIGYQCAITATHLIDQRNAAFFLRWGNDAAATFDMRQFPKAINLPLRGAIDLAMAGQTPTIIEIEVIPAKPLAPTMRQYTQPMTIYEGIIGPFFVEFVEAHKGWIQHTYGAQQNWPDIFYFGNVIRNCLSHGGKIHFTYSKPRAAIWYHLKYDDTDNGKSVIYHELNFADLLMLMVEMSNAFDNAKCPLL